MKIQDLLDTEIECKDCNFSTAIPEGDNTENHTSDVIRKKSRFIVKCVRENSVILERIKRPVKVYEVANDTLTMCYIIARTREIIEK